MATIAPVAGTTGLTYDDLVALREHAERDMGLRERYELLDGELLVSPSPILRHQHAVIAIGAALYQWAKAHGGMALTAPMDVWFSDITTLQPDVLFMASGHGLEATDRRIEGPPDLVVEVSSPSTRRQDLVRKRRVYEREGVPEFWFVDLDGDQVQVYRLGDEDTYGPPTVMLPDGDGHLDAVRLEGFTISAQEVLVLED